MGQFSNIDLIISGGRKDLGGGFVVRRTLPNVKKRMVGPFIFFDHMGPVDLQVGQGMDVRPHPHIGLSTLTYLFEGEILHRDTLGYEQAIRPGAVNWMTAGSGVAHSERSSQEARTRPQKLHGLQIWIALPKEHEEVQATFDHYSHKDIPQLNMGETEVRVVAGEFEKYKSPVHTYSDLIYLDLKLLKNQPLELPESSFERALYIVGGSVKVGDSVLSSGDMGVFETGKPIRLNPQSDARAMILGGTPFPETRYIWWNFVSSSEKRIEQAKADWVNKNFGSIKGETEFIPLPTS